MEVDPEKLKVDSCIYPNLESGCFLYQYRNALNEAAYMLALDDPSLVHRKGELQAMAKINLDKEGYGYKRKKSRSQAFAVEEPPQPAKLSPSLRTRRIREIEEDLREVNLEITLIERSRTKARNVNNDDRARHLTQEIDPLRKRKRKLEDELVVLQRKEAKSCQQKKKRIKSVETESGNRKMADTNLLQQQHTVDKFLLSGNNAQNVPQRSESHVVVVLDGEEVSKNQEDEVTKGNGEECTGNQVKECSENLEEGPESQEDEVTPSQHESPQKYQQSIQPQDF